MATDVKFCGLTRPEDAAFAVELGAGYAGMIFASGPRLLTLGRAVQLVAALPAGIRRVGVFADQPVDEIERFVDALGLHVVQLHGASDRARIDAVRERTGAQIWPVLRIAGAVPPPNIAELIAAGDGLLLDAYAPGALGGTGLMLPWAELASALADHRDNTPIILAGGLRPENVALAIAALSPDVVDVSSGVERAPGIKDHDRMRAFRDAVSTVSISI